MNIINTKVQKLQAQKEALDAQIKKLEELESATFSIKNLLVLLLTDYATEASEELPIIWEALLKIGQQHGLSVQPLAADELREWEADRAELENLRLEVKILRFAIAQAQPDNEPEVWRKGEIAPELENLYQEVLVENTEADSLSTLTDEEYDAAVEEELALAGDATTAIYEEAFADSPEPEYEPEEASAVAITPVENSEVPGQLSLKFLDPIAASEQTKLQKLLEGNSNFTFEELGVSVKIQSVFTEEEIESENKDESDDPATEKVEEALIIACNAEGRHWRYYVNAQTFIYQYTIESLEQVALGYAQHFLRDLEKQAKAKEEITQWNAENAQQSESAKPDTETEFKMMEFVKISNAVGYLKRRDNGELIAGYAAFSNKLPDGHRATTQAKSRAQKWAEWLKETFELECDAPRIAKRMISDNSKQSFAYEVKIKGVSIGQLTKLAEEDFSLLPGEVEEQQQNTELLRSELKTSPMPLNEIEQATELRNDGLTMEFAKAPDFAEQTPEYIVTIDSGKPITNVWISLREVDSKLARVWRYKGQKDEIGFVTKEAAAIAAISQQAG